MIKMSIEPIESDDARLVQLRTPDDGTAADDAGRPEESGGRVSKALGIVVGIALAAVIVAPVTLSAEHLIGWASSKTGLDLPLVFAWIVFLALDLAAVACIGMVTLCAMRGEGAGGFKIGTWAFAAGSAWANHVGGHGAGQWFFPAMSLAGPTLLEMVLAKVKSWARIAEGAKMSARPRFGIRWLPGIAFQETARAWAVSRRENIPRALDAIAFVREVDVLAGMEDADAVRYAAAALASADPHALRQWLTSRGKVVAQGALPALRVPAAVVPSKPEPVRPRRRQLSLPAPQSVGPRPMKGDPTSHPKWDQGAAEFRRSIAEGNPMSQRELADRLNMKNRQLAAQIITHVRREG